MIANLNQHRILFFSVLFVCASFIASSCKPDCDLPSDNSFDNASSADFKIGKYFSQAERANLADTLIVSDTFVNRKFIYFVGPKGFESYEWQIGDDLRSFSDQEFGLIFSDPEPSIRVQLIVSGPPEPRCFVNPDGRDTMVKYFTVVPWQETKVFGTFRGVMDSAPTDTLEVTYDFDLVDKRPTLININLGCENYEAYTMMGDFGYRFAVIGSNDYYFKEECMDPVGSISISQDHKRVVIPFSRANTISDPNPRMYDRFTGVRVE